MYASTGAGSTLACGRPLSSARVRLALLLCASGLLSCVTPALDGIAGPPVESAPELAAPEPEPAAENGRWFTFATSVEGRPIRAATLGHGARRVLWVGGIHGDEREGTHATAELPAAFLAQPGASERVTLL